MHSLAPDAITLINFIEDGADTRHYHFRLNDPQAFSRWQQAQPGQFFMLCVPESGEAAFTFTRLPDAHGKFSALVRKAGSVTTSLFQKPAGSVLGIRGPFGHGWPMQAIDNKRLLVIGGGCGLAPLAALIDQQITDGRHTGMAVIYGARNPTSQMLAAERERWKETAHLYEVIENVKGNSCTMQGTPLDALPSATQSLGGLPQIVMICGPEAMMVAVATELCRRGVPSEAIYLSMERRMHCGIGLCGHCYINDRYACTDGPVFSWQAIASLTSQ